MRIAVVGAGVAGLGAAWSLGRDHEGVVYERESRFGGHSCTVDVSSPDGRQPVDVGFIVYNERNYPNLVALFAYLVCRLLLEKKKKSNNPSTRHSRRLRRQTQPQRLMPPCTSSRR